MRVSLNDVGKRYNREWIFRHVNLEISTGDSYAILGSNGSGKSTLLQLIAGNQLQSEGKIEYYLNENLLSVDRLFPYISFASPYLELIEEFTLFESLAFHAQFKAFVNSFTIADILSISQLEKAKDKELKYFSSGMKQRVRLVLAILSEAPFLFLDEPTSNLDKNGILWYNKLIQDFTKNKIVVVCSNHQLQEYEFCKKQILIEDYK
jgi:ABC-type multidrug transport system ATPase subunit